MKIFCAIFSFYLLLLAVQPCQDFVPEGMARQVQSCEKALRCESDQMPPDDHECSPFCTCSCKQAPAAQENFYQPSEQEIAAIMPQTPADTFQNNYFHQFPDTIWQPPKNNSIV
jgi:hypothetical protein